MINEGISAIKHIAWLTWASFSLQTIGGILSSHYKAKEHWKKAENVEFCIVTVANRKVKNALYYTLKRLKERFPEYNQWIVIDEGAELQHKLEKEHQNVVVVPKKYGKRLIGKGRAINYFIEKHVEKGKWYVFIDDDNIIIDDEFLYEITKYEKEGYVAANPILVPRKGRSEFTYIADWIRYFDDISVFRVFTGVFKKPLAGLHGELLIAKGEVLKEIKYDKPSITEDFRFACELVKRNYKTWQSKTKVSIKSPNSIKDLLNQRGRWAKGIIHDLKDAPLQVKLVTGIRTVLWSLNIFGSWLFFPLWFLWTDTPLVFLIGGITYWAMYLYGIKKAKKIKYVLTIPIFGILEALSIFWGLNHKGFVVIDKN